LEQSGKKATIDDKIELTEAIDATKPTSVAMNIVVCLSY